MKFPNAIHVMLLNVMKTGSILKIPKRIQTKRKVLIPPVQSTYKK